MLIRLETSQDEEITPQHSAPRGIDAGRMGNGIAQVRRSTHASAWTSKSRGPLTDLTKLARGQPCLIRVPTVCSGNPETTVACHVRMIGLSGAGTKAKDLLIAFGCYACHVVVDGHQKSSYSYAERRQMLLEGMARTQAWLAEQGYITW